MAHKCGPSPCVVETQSVPHTKKRWGGRFETEEGCVMQMEMENRVSDASIDAALERLRRDLFGAQHEDKAPEDQVPDPIDYASLELEVERMRKRLAIWEIFMTYMRDGARSWPEVQRSLTKEDFDKIVSICDGIPLRDLLLDLR
jgi:hypothetical protein